MLLAVYDEDDDVFRSISRCMSFSDDMYEAMREFYFRGTCYPSGVGIDSDLQKEGDIQPIQEEAIEDVGFSDGEHEVESDIDDPDDEQHEADSLGGEDVHEEKFVNCYPSRPSSAHIVTNEEPSLWFRPLEVFEVSFADMSLSRQHTAAAGLIDDPEGRGIALRFPRFKRRRPDKKPRQATTCSQIADLFYKQSKIGSSGIPRAQDEI